MERNGREVSALINIKCTVLLRQDFIDWWMVNKYVTCFELCLFIKIIFKCFSRFNIKCSNESSLWMIKYQISYQIISPIHTHWWQPTNLEPQVFSFLEVPVLFIWQEKTGVLTFGQIYIILIIMDNLNQTVGQGTDLDIISFAILTQRLSFPSSL